ncbi:ABC transporter ATP-binding protein [Microbacterium sp. LWH7-1.2]|uniref:ABC transporter ATP-binding protein n=1 Tax=Microbacterium sp. LWH7-1.2 TaxID=3135257 RepID=UPI00313946F0
MSTQTEPILVAKDLRLGYGDLIAVWGADIEVSPGRTTALLGRNGAGKTTLLSGLLGLLPVKSGSVTFRGTDVTRKKPWKRVGMGIGLVQEGKRVFRNLTVQENLIVSLPGGSGRGRHAELLEKTWENFPVLAERRTQLGAELSGGQQQMLSIATAVCREPDVLLIDEPSSGLSPVAVEQVFEVIASLKKSGLAILLVEQQIDEVLNGNADDIVVIDQGRVVLNAPASEVSADAIASMILGAV